MHENISFIKLIEDYSIHIPEIQRDYAQGRTDNKTSEIRAHFLDEIFSALLSNDGKPLVLDFVYGSTDVKNVFLPLDGQQRLTTLFLLHWYLSPNEVRQIFNKFTYLTRISSKDFCNALVSNSLVEIKKNIENEKWNLSTGIMNEPWFHWSWSKDPTISGMLIMLDAIDERIKEESNEQYLWRKLTEEKMIVFHLLPLEKFNLSDELYVKMNARGKDLSDFDIIKSILEEQMKKNNVNEQIQNKWCTHIDSKWMDLFWNKKAIPYLTNMAPTEEDRAKIVEKIEIYYLRFIERMMYFHLFIIDDFDIPKELNIEQFPEGIKSVREYVSNNAILDLVTPLSRCGFFNETFFEFVINSMDDLLYEDNSIIKDMSEIITIKFWNQPTCNLLELFIDEKITYLNRILFFAVIQFSKYNPANKVHSDIILQKEFNSWMRVIRNLAYNTTYNDANEFRSTIESLVVLSKTVYGDFGNPNILNYLSQGGSVTRFSNEQINEEKEKASLIIKNEDYVDKIFEAENYAFFNGAIRFLFTDRNINYTWSLFNDRFFKTKIYFNEKGVSDEYRDNARLICTLISLFTNWGQCWGNNKIRIGNGIEVWGYIIRNKNLLQPLSDLLDLDIIPSEIIDYSSSIVTETSDNQFREKVKMIHSDMCNNELIEHALGVMGEGIQLNWKYNQFCLYRPNANADRKKYVIGSIRNAIFFDLVDKGIIVTDQNISEIAYFWGWDLYFKHNSIIYRFNTNDLLQRFSDKSEIWEPIEISLDKIKDYFVHLENS